MPALQQTDLFTLKVQNRKLTINSSALLKHIKNMKQLGMLEHIGGTRGYWQIKKEL